MNETELTELPTSTTTRRCRPVERPDLGPRARRVVDALSGRSLRAVASHLAEIERFQRAE
jgi:hypothetical protein